jgi:hypothetical protein
MTWRRRWGGQLEDVYLHPPMVVSFDGRSTMWTAAAAATSWEQGRAVVSKGVGRTPRPSGFLNSHPLTREGPIRVISRGWVGDPLVRPAPGPSLLNNS